MKLEAGQVALVTGASRGLGVEIARHLAGRGLDLVLAARSAAALEEVAAQLRSESGRKVTVRVTDLANVTDLQELAREVGGVDVLINNAGVEGAARFNERTRSEIEQSIAINLTGPMLLTHAVLPSMIAKGQGHIVNIASIAGLIAVPFNEPYCATKFGLVGFTRALRMTARASSWGVSASVVCPGFIEGAGMFEALKERYGVSSEGMGAVSVEALGHAVLDVIERDLPDAVVAQGDPRQAAAMSILEPQAVEAASMDSPAANMFRSVADARREHSPETSK